MTASAGVDAGVAPAPTGADAVLRLFAALWAVAALFHVLGPSGRATGVVHDVSGVGVAHALVGLVALGVLLLPGRLLPLVLLAVLGPVTAWQEAPVLGNHWLVVAVVDCGLLLALVAARRDRAGTADGFLPVARWVLVVFYAFAAFAKLNSGFFDTTVSCSSVYFDETARTLGIGTPLAVGKGGWASLVPVSAAAIELSVPLLLCVRRTRRVGVVVGLVFHSIIAIDQEHLFSDFSATLSALFVLFLPSGYATWVLDLVRRRAKPAVVAWGALAGLTLGAQWLAPSTLTDIVLVDGRMWLWYLVDGALVATVAWWLWSDRTPAVARPLALPRAARWLAIVPVLTMLNGLTPYLELKTAFSYNMYSNLQTAGGESNHLLVRATLPIGHRLDDLVQVEATDDPGLVSYVRQQLLLPWDSLRSYLSTHRDARVRYVRGGIEHDLAHASDEPSLVEAPPLAVQKLAPLRSVDSQDPPRCQEGFLPAL